MPHIYMLNTKTVNVHDLNQLLDLGKFDIILLVEVLEHLADPKKVFKNLLEVLENDGIIIATTPNVKFKKFINNCAAHEKEYTKNEILEFGKDLNLETHVRFFGSYFTSFLDKIQMIVFPIVVKRKNAFRIKLKPYNCVYIILLPILSKLCQIESYIFNNLFCTGYHLFITFRRK